MPAEIHEVASLEAVFSGDAVATRRFLDAERDAARRILARRETSEVPALVGEAYDRLEPIAHHFTRSAPPACARGCSWCCRGGKVEATAPEVLAIADFVKRGRSADEIAALAGEAAERASATRDLDSEQRWAKKLPCRFLDDASGECSVYSVRPLACRLHASLDAEACEQASADPTAEAPIPRHMVPVHVFGTAKRALIDACEEAGLDARNFELTSAFSVAMNEPNAAERWLRGGRLFDAASLPSDERDRVLALRTLSKQGLIPPERLIASARTRPEKNAAKRKRRAQRNKDR